jgi:hypothetical protein
MANGRIASLQRTSAPRLPSETAKAVATRVGVSHELLWHQEGQLRGAPDEAMMRHRTAIPVVIAIAVALCGAAALMLAAAPA